MNESTWEHCVSTATLERLSRAVAGGRERRGVIFVHLPMAGEGDRIFAEGSKADRYKTRHCYDLYYYVTFFTGPKQERGISLSMREYFHVFLWK